MNPDLSFRDSWKKDWKTRWIDNLCHIAFAVLIPGPWWFQFLPDAMVPVMFAISWKRDRFLQSQHTGDVHWMVAISKDLHNVLVPYCLLFVIALLLLKGNMEEEVRITCWLCLHWSGHLLIDAFTHRKWKKYEKEISRL
jgi:hypothetical protein